QTGAGVVVDAEDQFAGDVALGLQRRVHGRLEGRVEPGGGGRRTRPDAVFDVVSGGDVVLVIHAVGDVDVDVEVRPVLQDQAADGPHLGLVQLEVVAVEVLVGGRVAPALDAGAALVRPAVGRSAFVAVDGQDRDEDQVGAVEQV